MRRFLSRSSTANRLVAVLVLSVVVPGLLLAWYGMQAVLQEDELYRATLRTRAESLASGLFRDLGDRMRRTVSLLDDAAGEAVGSWGSDPEASARMLREAEPLVGGVLVLDSGNKLRFPHRVAASLVDRIGGESASRAYLQPLLREGERLEMAGRWADAAEAYAAATEGMPGQRGRGVARLARARCLLKAGAAEDALAEYESLVRDHPGERDLNDFPMDWLARLQSAIALRQLGRPVDAATTLVDLLDGMLPGLGTYGGYGETAIGWRALNALEDGLLASVPQGKRPDISALRRRVAQVAERQSEQAMVLDLLPTLATDSLVSDVRPRHFQLHTATIGGRTLLFARAWWDRGDAARRIIVHLDDRALKSEIESALTTAQRASPEFTIDLVRTVPDLRESGSVDFRVVRPLDPWLPGYSLVVSGSDEVLVGPSRQQQRVVRLGMIGGLLVIIIVGILVIGRAVSREMEIARLKSDFVSNVSHELRTPLTTIRIMAEMLALGAVPAGDKQQEYFRNIVSEAERLSRLINNVLDFARIEEGRKKFSFGMGDIGDAVYEVERITGDYVRSEGFTLRAFVDDDLPPTAFDRDAIIQALINLMSNAVKYSQDDKRIEMGARSDRDSIAIWVRDHGPGIDPKEIPHLFEKFYRGGDHMTREVRGAGLGLSIVQHIVSAHRGHVTVDSKPPDGSTFTIVLPVSTVAQLEGTESKR